MSQLFIKMSKFPRNQRGGELELLRDGGRRAECWSALCNRQRFCSKAEQRPTTVELQLVVEIVQLLLDVRGTRTVVTGAERQQHVDLKYEKTAFSVFMLCTKPQ